jgi:hypothetical protein
MVFVGATKDGQIGRLLARLVKLVDEQPSVAKQRDTESTNVAKQPDAPKREPSVAERVKAKCVVFSFSHLQLHHHRVFFIIVFVSMFFAIVEHVSNGLLS